MKKTGLADSPLFVKKNEVEKTQLRNRTTMVSRHQNDMKSYNQDELIAEINKALQEVGKQVSTYRLTKSEKNFLIDSIYKYRLEGIITSENEIIRIGLNFILLEHKVRKESSILNKVIIN